MGKQIENSDNIIQNDDGIKLLKEFYKTFYFNDKIHHKEIIKKKFISERILNRIDSLNSNENELVLDYDPFIKGQDFFGNAIKKTIDIKTLKNKNQFRVSFSLFGGENEETTNIDFLLKKNKKGDYLIYSILNDEYLNFKKKRCFYKNIIKNKTIHVEKLYNNKTKISIIDIKNDNILQEIDYEPYSFNFECKSSIYDGNVNIHNDYEIIIGDYNFDELQDFAILNDNTINTGTIFSYFFQNNQGQFYQNKNFPLNLIPSKINSKNKTLTQQNIIGCCKIGVNVYQLKGNIWLNILSEEKDMDR